MDYSDYPTVFNEESMIPKYLAQGPLFSSANIDDTGEQFIKMYDGSEVFVSGGRFNQFDLAVSLTTRKFMISGDMINPEFSFSEFIEKMKRADGTNTRSRVYESLLKCKNIELGLSSENKKSYLGSRVKKVSICSGGIKTVQDEGYLNQAYNTRENMFSLNVDLFLSLRSSLTSWLYAFISSEPELRVIDIDHLYELSGSTSKSVNEFAKGLRCSLMKLKDLGAINSNYGVLVRKGICYWNLIKTA